MAAEQPKNKNGIKKKKISDEYQEDDIFQAPEIIREPSSRQARLGSNVVLRITATGKPIPSFQWFHNGKKISGANSDRLTLSKLRRASAGAYHCEAKNHVGKVASRACMLSFFTQKVPKLVLNHRELDVEEGQPIVLKVVTSDPNAFKEFRVFWVFNGMRIKGAYGLELSIAAGKKKYEGEYKAMISVGSGIETSNVCKITIVAGKAVKAVPAPAESADDAQADGTMVGTLKPEEAAAAPAPAPQAATEPAEDWNDFLFNPEDEEVAQDEGTKEFDSREIRMSAKEAEEVLVAASPSPLDLIESLKQEQAEPIAEEAPFEPDPLPAPIAASEEEDEDSMIVDWDAMIPAKAKPRAAPVAAVEELVEEEDVIATEPVAEVVAASVTPITEKPRKRAPAPKLVKRKEFLENMLARWQRNMGKFGKDAA